MDHICLPLVVLLLVRSLSVSSLLEDHAAPLRRRGPGASRRGPGAQRRDNSGGKGIGDGDGEFARSIINRVCRSPSLLFLFFFLRSGLEAPPAETALDAGTAGEEIVLVLKSGIQFGRLFLGRREGGSGRGTRS